LIAAASRTAKNVADFSKGFGGLATYSDYRQMLEREQPSMVSVCASPRNRASMVRAAVEAGTELVWVEEPFALATDLIRESSIGPHLIDMACWYLGGRRPRSPANAKQRW